MLSAIFLAVGSISALGVQEPGQVIDPSSLRVVGADGKLGEACPLQGTRVSAKVEGFGARVIVVQTFTNPSKTPIEAVYTFPLPQDSAVDGMRMIIGDRIIDGIIKKKEEAKKVYEEAKQQGKSAALLDQERPNVFTQSVANIPPGAEIQVALTYVQILKFEKDEFEFVFPMVVGHRYTDAATPDPEKINPPIVPAGTRSGSTIDLELDLDAGAPIMGMRSVLHKVETERLGDNRAKVRLAKADEIPNRDFIFRYTIASSELVGGLLTHIDPKLGGFFTLILMPPKTVPSAQVAPKEVIYVMDVSGSQRGFPIDQSKKLTLKLIDELNPNDTFNVVSFSNDFKHLWARPQPNTAAHRAEAKKHISSLEAVGGTDLHRAVAAALAPAADPERPRIIAFNTDGFIGDEATALREVRRHRGNARMFVFGIGNSVNRYLIQAMSAEGRGDYEVITLNPQMTGASTMADRASIPKDQMEKLDRDADAAAQRFVQRTDSPVLLDVQVKFEGVSVKDTLPRLVPDVFSEKPVVIKGRYDKPGNGSVAISGLLAGKKWSKRIPITFPASGNSGSAIGSLWAREKVNDLELQERFESVFESQAVKGAKHWEDAITNLALQFSIMTRFTSFVAVDQRVVNPSGQQETVRVPVNMADGVDYLGIFGTMKAKEDLRLAKAPGTPAFRPGDPLLSVVAPADAKVVAEFPGGDLKDLAWNAASKKWEGRFDIPASFREGLYQVRVHILESGGKRHSLLVPFEVSVTAPQLAPSSQRQADGTIRLELEGDPRWARVLLLPPWGERLEFVFDRETGKIRLDLKLPAEFKGGWFTMIGTDRAFSQATIRLYLNTKGEIEKIEPVR